MGKGKIHRRSEERELQSQVVQLARLLGWRVYHSRPAQYADGRWTTPITGDTGLPDLILCKPPRLIFAELKSEQGRLSDAQRQWLHALDHCPNVEVYVWRPSDWELIVSILSDGTEGGDTK